MKALSPQDLQLSYDQCQVNDIIEKFNEKLKKEGINKNGFYHVVISGEYNRIQV